MGAIQIIAIDAKTPKLYGVTSKSPKLAAKALKLLCGFRYVTLRGDYMVS